MNKRSTQELYVELQEARAAFEHGQAALAAAEVEVNECNMSLMRLARNPGALDVEAAVQAVAAWQHGAPPAVGEPPAQTERRTVLTRLEAATHLRTKARIALEQRLAPRFRAAETAYGVRLSEEAHPQLVQIVAREIVPALLALARGHARADELRLKILQDAGVCSLPSIIGLAQFVDLTLRPGSTIDSVLAELRSEFGQGAVPDDIRELRPRPEPKRPPTIIKPIVWLEQVDPFSPKSTIK